VSERSRTVRFRANPGYELVLPEQLEPAVRSHLPASELDTFAVLRPRDGVSLPVRVVDRETALLFLLLAKAAPLPEYMHLEHESAIEEIVVRLVTGFVLELESAGVFSSDAAELRLAAAATPQGRLGELSRAALRYGYQLRLDDPEALAWRLYAFHRLPLTAAWAERLANDALVEDFLGISERGPHRRALRSWRPRRLHAGWWVWWSRHRVEDHSDAPFKLYLSPQPEALPRCFGEALEYLAESALSLKVAASPAGVMRPDKLVAHFSTLEDLANGARALSTVLAGQPAQGVPFAAEITPDGLLSWGLDPPLAARTRLSSEAESWRLSLVRELGHGLVESRRRGEDLDGACAFALHRLAGRGVDTSSWLPSESRRLELGT
jgi:hypothetical protein